VRVRSWPLGGEQDSKSKGKESDRLNKAGGKDRLNIEAAECQGTHTRKLGDGGGKRPMRRSTPKTTARKKRIRKEKQVNPHTFSILARGTRLESREFLFGLSLNSCLSGMIFQFLGWGGKKVELRAACMRQSGLGEVKKEEWRKDARGCVNRPTRSRET